MSPICRIFFFFGRLCSWLITLLVNSFSESRKSYFYSQKNWSLSILTSVLMLLILKNGLGKKIKRVCLSEEKHNGPEDLSTFFLDESVEYIGSLPKYIF